MLRLSLPCFRGMELRLSVVIGCPSDKTFSIFQNTSCLLCDVICLLLAQSPLQTPHIKTLSNFPERLTRRSPPVYTFLIFAPNSKPFSLHRPKRVRMIGVPLYNKTKITTEFC
ncbi:hypothetical protein T4D_7702 [Trichinella pseudospiralis]|uniref:Uncharacterized protein n=1 Tax=Trichinella pseudospiralis TaxID=6337 RepID=A0A0V1F8U0_TRIPS|nr:hypothetical protein T4D_7702 [Trichinella pseudospiralis]